MSTKPLMTWCPKPLWGNCLFVLPSRLLGRNVVTPLQASCIGCSSGGFQQAAQGLLWGSWSPSSFSTSSVAKTGGHSPEPARRPRFGKP